LHIATAADSFTVTPAITTIIGVLFSTSGCYTQTSYGLLPTPTAEFFAAGFSASALTCLDYAVDGYVITGRPIAYLFTNNFTLAPGTPTPGATKGFLLIALKALAAPDVNPAGYVADVHNFGSIVSAMTEPVTGNIFFVISSNERYWHSYLVVGIDGGLNTGDVAV